MLPPVKATFDAFPPEEREGLLALRAVILDVAAGIEGVGPLEEALRWGQPSYLTTKSRSGSTLRLGMPKGGGYALFVNCNTSLIEDFRPIAPKNMQFEGRRAVLFGRENPVDTGAIRILIANALTYHRKG